jgi:selenide,water dikinase
VDFFTPVVDDPFVYGQVAATNALSDIYAMGGVPKFALSVVAFPDDKLEEDVLRQALFGGIEKMREASVPVIGGHSIRDAEMKFGYVVTGVVAPDRLYRNVGARPGDALVLTKPLGAGIITTAIKFGVCPPEVAKEAIDWMLLLNREASELLSGFSVHAVTDITGYGLVGHAFEMASASHVCFRFHWSEMPLMGGLEEIAKKGALPGGIGANRRFVGDSVNWNTIGEIAESILLDPQTSGGLLISLPGAEVESLLGKFKKQGVFGVKIGEVEARSSVHIRVV